MDQLEVLVDLEVLMDLMGKDLMDQVVHHLKLLRDPLDQEALLDLVVQLTVPQDQEASVPRLTLRQFRRCLMRTAL